MSTRMHSVSSYLQMQLCCCRIRFYDMSVDSCLSQSCTQVSKRAVVYFVRKDLERAIPDHDPLVRAVKIRQSYRLLLLHFASIGCRETGQPPFHSSIRIEITMRLFTRKSKRAKSTSAQSQTAHPSTTCRAMVTQAQS
jgi:hypothetical protein